MNTLVLFAEEYGALTPEAIALTAEGHFHSTVSINTLSTEVERTIIVLDGRATASHLIELPDFPENKLAQILPGLMEGRVATSPAETHFAIVPESGELRPVISVRRSIMDGLQKQVTALGLKASALIPDYLCLEKPEVGALACEMPSHMLVRTAGGGGFAAEVSIAKVMEPSATIKGKIEARQLAELAAKADCSLLQGAYSPKHDLLASLVLFKRAGYIASAAFALWLGSALYAASNNYGQAEALYQASNTVFRQALPDVTRVVNAEVQMRQKVMELRQRSGGVFFLLSDHLFRAVEASEQTILEGLRFDSEREELAVTLSFSSFAEGEGLKASLQNVGILVAEGSSRQESGRVYSDLTLRRAN